MVSTKIFFGTGSDWPNAKGLSRKHIIEGTKGGWGGRGREGWRRKHPAGLLLGLPSQAWALSGGAHGPCRPLPLLLQRPCSACKWTMWTSSTATDQTPTPLLRRR